MCVLGKVFRSYSCTLQFDCIYIYIYVCMYTNVVFIYTYIFDLGSFCCFGVYIYTYIIVFAHGRCVYVAYITGAFSGPPPTSDNRGHSSSVNTNRYRHSYIHPHTLSLVIRTCYICNRCRYRCMYMCV